MFRTSKAEIHEDTKGHLMTSFHVQFSLSIGQSPPQLKVEHLSFRDSVYNFIVHNVAFHREGEGCTTHVRRRNGRDHLCPRHVRVPMGTENIVSGESAYNHFPG